MVPALVETIKSYGLALVTDESATSSTATSPFPQPLQGIDGVLKRHGVLTFNEGIDI